MTARLILVGDMHLGRRPSRLPLRLLEEESVDPRLLTPVAAWRSVVDHACALEADAVVLAGDVVESDAARWEALPELQRQVERLLAAGIDVCAVSGNHDVEALPVLARNLPGFRLLGRGGRWELHPVRRDGATVANILGWSFPQRRVDTSPLAQGLPAAPGDGVPTIGILHCDLAAPGSVYAPVRRAELAASWPDAWFLGHIHEPSLPPAGRALGYLGSLVGLDPGETGARGAWEVEVGRDGRLAWRHLPLSPLRWERVDVPVDDYDRDGRTLQDLLVGAMAARHAAIRAEGAEPRLVGIRLRLCGRTAQHASLAAELAALRAAGADRLRVPADGCLLFAEQVIDDSAAAWDLERLAAGRDLPALLARDILSLEHGDGAAGGILRTARAELDEAITHPNFSPLGPAPATDPADDDELRRLLLVTAHRTLDALLAQRRDPDAPA
jgi:exonuclease SbcD